mmetsp:Transcript_9008/g.39729  ORF Transcript_9008/g.39729 Transcript_9008/m.39729 type:complete len:273 (-) Transcript_9008:500-1318(-)
MRSLLMWRKKNHGQIEASSVKIVKYFPRKGANGTGALLLTSSVLEWTGFAFDRNTFLLSLFDGLLNVSYDEPNVAKALGVSVAIVIGQLFVIFAAMVMVQNENVVVQVLQVNVRFGLRSRCIKWFHRTTGVTHPVDCELRPWLLDLMLNHECEPEILVKLNTLLSVLHPKLCRPLHGTRSQNSNGIGGPLLHGVFREKDPIAIRIVNSQHLSPQFRVHRFRSSDYLNPVFHQVLVHLRHVVHPDCRESIPNRISIATVMSKALVFLSTPVVS